ncbi:hypothetical protein [Asanoa iriomotensis]|uniref:Uncharacterized protein n=1 Tax=Asanoa iriomotensis TaxID=234613 RepID=A0ABQ4C0R4_9ACTN|nr:hypothetical protein [Asanoa iriomotensis]GIF56377.1 hypothetical protein Air01nite_24720 [Asanoa iriomotensis]
MNSDLEERLTSTLARAADAAPVLGGADPVAAVRARQRRRRRRRATLASACAVVVAAVSGVTATQVAGPSPAPKPDPAVVYGFAPDRIPDFANLPEPEQLWPDAVHKLPGRLPDGSQYAVAAVLGDGRYLVTGGLWKGDTAPSVFDTRAGTVTELGTPTVSDGFVPGLGLLMAREVNGQAVWFLEGSRNNRSGREIWAAPLDGGPARHLADLPDGVAPRFSVAGNAIIWDQQGPGNAETPPNSVHTVSLDGGPAKLVPGSQGFDLTNIGPWIKNQHRGTGTDPRTAGELRNVVTGERRPWKAAPSLQYVFCGPTWCAGKGSGGAVALQSLDGSDPVVLPHSGDLAQAAGGRLAVGYLDVANGRVRVVWDRTTGWAAGIRLPRGSDAPARYRPNGDSSDYEPEVIPLSATDEQLVVLDLRAVN